jgi:acyl carrier protein
MSDRIADQVITVVAAAQQIPRERVTLDSTLEELGVDSLSSLEIMAELENQFGISIPNSDALAIRTVRQAVESLERVLAAAAPGTTAPEG